MDEKDRVRRPSEEAERQNAAATRHRLLAGYFAAGLLSLALIAGLVVVLLGGDGGKSSKSEGQFGTHYQGLQERRVEAGVPTMGEGGGSHFHPHIDVFMRGKQLDVPANIGIDPALPPLNMAGLHTHDTSGTIHNEAGDNSTLSQFFAIWGVPLSESRLGPHRAQGSVAVRMWVDGKPSRAFGALELADGQQIVVTYGTAEQIPNGLPA